MPLRVHQVPAATTYPLRQRILRPHQTLDQVAFPGEGEGEGGAGAGHFAAYEGQNLVGVATVLHEAPTSPLAGKGGDWWRLRGMATTEPRRGTGTALLKAVVDHATAAGGTHLWCHARVAAVPFYLAMGFRPEGDRWEEPFIGPHLAMWRAIP